MFRTVGFGTDLVGVSLIASGIGTIVHVIRFKLFTFRGKTFYYGTGVVSVMGCAIIGQAPAHCALSSETGLLIARSRSELHQSGFATIITAL